MERLKKAITNILLAFVFISIGFALGKHSVTSIKQSNIIPGEKGHHVVVYYLHSTFRCVTCNEIEKMTFNLLNKFYKKQLADSTIIWIEDDFQQNETLAKKFNVVASCVVVAEIENGIVKDYKRLDDVWTLMREPEVFDKYIRDAIEKYLKKIGDKK